MSEIGKLWRRDEKKMPDASPRSETRDDPDKLTKIDVRNIVFYYGTAAVVLGNLLYDWAKSFR